MSDLLYSETEDDLRAAVRSLLTDRAGHQELLGRIETDSPYVPGLWKALAGDMGAAGLLVPEKLGGQGASHREAAVVLEELGRAATPAPYFTSAVVATETLLALAGDSAPAAELLSGLATGGTVAVLAVPLTASPYADPATAFTATGAADPAIASTVTGAADPTTASTVTGVADAVAADVLLVPRADGLYAVPAGEATVEPQTPLDLTRPLARVTTEAGTGTRLAGPDEARAAVRRGLLAGAGLLASEQLGLAEWCLEETVRHTRERHQFNRPVGSFQALKHRMAQLWLDLVGARAAARAAADALATGSPDAPLTVAVAQAYCSKVAVRAAEECVQLHGGIGMTWEHPAHLALKRAKSDQLALGSAGRHQDAIAALVDLPAPA
ncbi:acyl-CoA dehydrogenase family protein [Streptomyces sp. WAC01280]|uniref:acyl-CoA dehydrogenase family protein n=1 Tax=Streptomyces sp. WAC01280 TaxID=2487424 RepID=UPI000F78F6E9|nr:acyl-CoA dehydrogenase family protein [Streptomyces sp. WAC01280]RSS58931.1 acyl-CoA dehydrogenase [Streptomyces sp. WAC01280]